MLTRSKKQKVVLLKGFASRIKWNKQDHKEYANQAIKLAKNANIISWDGDLAKSDSFTVVLTELMKKFPNKEYHAFKKTKHIHKLAANHTENNYGVPSSGYNHPIIIHRAPNNTKWNALGKIGLDYFVNAGHDVHVIALGGGNVVRDEFAQMEGKNKYKNVKRTQFPITR